LGGEHSSPSGYFGYFLISLSDKKKLEICVFQSMMCVTQKVYDGVPKQKIATIAKSIKKI
jgi:hypothetical protein